MATILSTKIILRNDTAANWLKYNPVLQAGELGIENDTGLFKIGNGDAIYADLPYANSSTSTLVADETSISVSATGIVGLNKWGQEYYRYVDGGTYELQVVDSEHPWKAGLIPKVAEVGGKTLLAWYEPSTQTIEEMAQSIDRIAASTLPLTGGTMTGNLVLADGSAAASENYVKQKIEDFASAVTDNGKVDTLMELISWVESHGGEVAGLTSSISNLEALVGDTSVDERISILDNASRARFESKRYEIVSYPPETLINYYDKEIRVMCPTTTDWATQHTIELKIYAPDNAYSFKQKLDKTTQDVTTTQYDSSSVDEFDRKYSVIQIDVAALDGTTNSWVYYGANSTEDKMQGFYYSVEWYDENGEKIDSDLIRINLSNEQCHSSVEPFYMGKIIKEVQINGIAASTTDNSVNIVTQQIVKDSDEIVVNENNSLSINQISIAKINTDDTTVILNGGGAG